MSEIDPGRISSPLSATERLSRPVEPPSPVQQPEEMELASRTEMAPSSGAQFKKLALTSGFAVDESTGERMIRALQDMLDALESRWSALERLGEQPMLSGTPTAQWVAQHTIRTATDEQGLLTQLRRARTELPQYIEAIQVAKRRYAETENSATDTLRTIDPS